MAKPWALHTMTTAISSGCSRQGASAVQMQKLPSHDRWLSEGVHSDFPEPDRTWFLLPQHACLHFIFDSLLISNGLDRHSQRAGCPGAIKCPGPIWSIGKVWENAAFPTCLDLNLFPSNSCRSVFPLPYFHFRQGLTLVKISFSS